MGVHNTLTTLVLIIVPAKRFSEMGLRNGLHLMFKCLSGCVGEECQPFSIDCNVRMNKSIRLGRKLGHGHFIITWIGDPRLPGTAGTKKIKCGKLYAMATILGQKNTC